MGIPDHLTCLLRNLYAGQEVTSRTGHGTTDWIQIGKGVCQWCILSPCLFNLNCQHPLGHQKSKRVPEKYMLLFYWLCQSLWLCGSQQSLENSSNEGNSSQPYLPPKKSVCRLLDSVGEGEGGMIWNKSIETCILSTVKQITSPGWMHETSAQGWCTGKTQRDRIGREAGGGIGMGNTCKSMADSCQYMTKTTTIL